VKRILKLTIWCLSFIAFAGLCIGAYFWYIWSSNLPYIGVVKEYRPPVITEIFSNNGEVIGRFWDEKRTVLPLKEAPEHLIQAFVAAEDSRFFQHEGVDIKGILRALFKNLAAGRIQQGGSTITQQVIKSLILKNVKKTYRRKAREAILAIQLENQFSKEHILFLYLNQIYLGHGAYGIEEAARTYFNKDAKDLDLAESALLAGLPQAPARYSPAAHFELAKARQKYVLDRMREEGYISAEEKISALKKDLDLRIETKKAFETAPYFTEHVRRYLLKKYGKDLLYRGGLKVYTTLDLKMQMSAKEALKKGLAELDKREGYRGPVKHLSDAEMAAFQKQALEKSASETFEIGSIVRGIVEKVDDRKKEVIIKIREKIARLPLREMKWARRPNPRVPYYSARVKSPSSVLRRGDVILVRILKRADHPPPPRGNRSEGSEKMDKFEPALEVSLEQVPRAQGSILCMKPDTGYVKAMVGGRDFSDSQFNRALQSRRQPGSAFKPIVYSAALDWGMTPSEVIVDSPYISDRKPDGEAWKPKNYKKKFYGPTLLRTALAKSRNVITIKILRKIGIDYAIDYARSMGIKSDLSPNLSLALGSSGVSLMELVRAYSVFANRGMLVKPIFVKRVVDRDHRVIEENQSEAVQAISKETAFVMTDLLRAVINEGTGRRIKALNRPAAGKTGTTNNLWDAWFMGYTPGFVTGVWVGYDNPEGMGKGETGSRAASPIWLYFMKEVLEGKPVVDFEAPTGVVFAKIDAKTGLLAGPYTKKSVFQSFREGTEPTRYSPGPTSPKSGLFSQFDMNSDK